MAAESCHLTSYFSCNLPSAVRNLATLQMATAPPLPPLPTALRPSAVRRFPPGCGRRHHNAAQQPQRTNPFVTSYPLPKPPAREAAKPPSPQRQRLHAAHKIPGTEGPDRGGRNVSVDEAMPPAATESTVRRVSAVRRFPPGCGRVVAVSKPEGVVVEGEGEADAGELQAAVRNGCQKEVLCHGDSYSNGGGEDDGGAQECGGRPWIVTGIMSVPFMPWAQHDRRSQQRRKLF